MRKLGCDTLPSNYFGTCGKNGINLCVEDVKKMIVKNTGKALPKGYGVRCDKCIDQAPKPGYARMHQCGSQEDDVSERRTLVLCFSRIKVRVDIHLIAPNTPSKYGAQSCITQPKPTITEF
ncbi:unnamed protein product [Brassica rapa subsp. trilocularis]